LSQPELLEVGRIGRAHGLNGEVAVAFTTDQIEARTAVGVILHAGARALTITASRPQNDRWLLKFDGVNDRTAAEKLQGAVLSAEPIDDPDAIWVHDIIGTRVVEKNSGVERGTVEAVQANPAHDLLVLDSGRLVPMVFVVSSDDGVTVIDPPEGLFDF
jgi:16S rRNA processing protein RimM